MQFSKTERIKKEVVKTKIFATIPTDVEINANDFKKAKSPIVVLVGTEGGILSLTIHHPVGVTTLGEKEWVATETEQYHYLEERALDPKAPSRLHDANVYVSTKLVKEYSGGNDDYQKKVIETLLKVDPGAKLGINSHGDITLEVGSSVQVLSALIKKCDEELDEDFYRKKELFIKEKKAYDMLVRGTPVKGRPEFNPETPMPEKRSKRAIFEDSKYENYFVLEQAVGDSLSELRKDPEVIKKRGELLKSDYETLGGMTKSTRQMPIPGFTGMDDISVRDHIINMIMHGPKPPPKGGSKGDASGDAKVGLP